MAKSWMLTQKAAAMSGKAFENTVALKNDAWTSAQPGALTVIQTRIPKTTTVLTSATNVERRTVGWRPRTRGGPPDGPMLIRSPESSGPTRLNIDVVGRSLRPEDRGVCLVGEPFLRGCLLHILRCRRSTQ